MWCDGSTVKETLNYFISQDSGAPQSEDTIRRVRKELSYLGPADIETLMSEEPTIKGFVLERRPDLKANHDYQVLSKIQNVFNRPAFRTEFHAESSIQDFAMAIKDTISALDNGVLKLSDGSTQKLPSRHDLIEQQARKIMDDIVMDLIELRTRYETYLRNGGIKLVAVQGLTWPLIDPSPEAAYAMDSLIDKILDDFRGIFPDFGVWRPASFYSGSAGSAVVNPFRNAVLRLRPSPPMP
jgi:hypothetical protein